MKIERPPLVGRLPAARSRVCERGELRLDLVGPSIDDGMFRRTSDVIEHRMEKDKK
jgi:hypothetical protein